MRKRIGFLCLALALIMALAAVFAAVRVHQALPFRPAYPREDLSLLLEKDAPEEADYKTLFFQTGLGRSAIDALWGDKDAITAFQQAFFCDREARHFAMAITTGMDRYVGDDGKPVAAFSLAPYEAGDVFVTESTHSFGWRHGHAGLALTNGRTLEAAMIGVDSQISSAYAWCEYTTFAILRYTGADRDARAELAHSAARNLTGIPYNLLAVTKTGTRPDSTQCAHLVWFAYHNAGFDIGGNGGPFVTVQNLIDNPDFEVVQIFGFDPARFWRD